MSDSEDSDAVPYYDEEDDVFDENLESEEENIQPSADLEKLCTEAYKELDDHNKNKFFAFMYKNPKTYYWGQLVHVFCDDADDDATDVQVKFLKRLNNTSDPTNLVWDWPAIQDGGIIGAKRCFFGPATPEIKKLSATSRRSGYSFPCEAAVNARFEEIAKKGLLI